MFKILKKTHNYHFFVSQWAPLAKDKFHIPKNNAFSVFISYSVFEIYSVWFQNLVLVLVEMMELELERWNDMGLFKIGSVLTFCFGKWFSWYRWYLAMVWSVIKNCKYILLLKAGWTVMFYRNVGSLESSNVGFWTVAFMVLVKD